MAVVQRIRFHAQPYLERPFLSSVVFVRLTGTNLFWRSRGRQKIINEDFFRRIGAWLDLHLISTVLPSATVTRRSANF